MHARTAARLLALLLLGAVASGCADDSKDKLLASARRYLARGDAAAAAVELKRALAKDEASPKTRALLGQALLDSGDPAAAQVELGRALEQGASPEQVLPALAKALLLLGQPTKVTGSYGSTTLAEPGAEAELKTWVAAAYSQQGQTEQAYRALDAALRAHPLFPAAVIVQARMRARDGDLDGALRTLDELLAKDPGNADAGVAKGYLLWLGRQDANGALAAHRKVLEARPRFVPALAEVVTILFRQGQAKEARQEFDKLRKAAPNHPETVFFEAQFAYVDGQYARSRELTDALLKLAPDHYRALELAAAAEYRLGHDLQAQDFAARALGSVPGLVLARQIMARSLLRSARPDKALAALAPLLQGKTADAASLVIAGEAYLQLGKAREADVAFKRAADLAPSDSRVRTAAALALADAGRADVAVKELEALAAGDPGPRTGLALLSARIAAGDFKGALAAADALREQMPNEPLPEQLRGQVLISLHDAAGARAGFEAARAKDAKYFPALAALASLDVAEGNPARARQRVEDYLKASPGHGQATLLLVQIPSASGALPADAPERLAQALRANPRDAQLHLALIARHLQRGDRPAALNAAQAAAAALPNDLALRQALGQAQLMAGQTQQAVSTLRQIVVQQPHSAAAQLQLAQALAQAGDRSGARAALGKALELDPDLAEARQALATLALADDRPQDALALAAEMQKRDPKSGLGHAVAGDIEAQRKNWPAAAAAYRKALDLSHATEAALKLHAVYLASNRAADAERLAAEWERQRPNDPAFRFYLGDLATNRGDLAAAESHYRAVLVGQPNNALALNNIAWLLHKQSKPGALEMAERANALMPNRAPLLDTLATIQAASGKLADALASQLRAVEASPQDPNFKLNLARLQVRAGKAAEAKKTLEPLAALGERFPRQAEVRALLKTL